MLSDKRTVIIPEDYAGKRLDQAMAALLTEYSRSQLKDWLVSNHILVDDAPQKPRYKVQGGETLTLTIPEEKKVDWVAEDIPLNIVHEDDSLIIIDKPAGIVVHPAAGNYQGTLVNALLHYLPALEQLPRAGIVHRLDKETSGLMVVAKTLTAHNYLVKALQERTVSRCYQTIVQGVMTAGGTVDAPIGRHPKQRQKMAVVDSGKEAITHYRVIKRFGDHTHIQVQLETGRTHQIRVHMAHIRYPIVGDPTYGTRPKVPKGATETLITTLQSFPRQALHAVSLSLEHPETHETISFTSDLPEDMQTLLKALEENDASH